MKSPYTCIYREIWNKEKFWGMSDSAQLVYVHLISSPLGNGIGCYKAGLEMLAEDKRMTSKAYRKAFGEVLSKALVEYNDMHRVIWIPKYIDRNEPGNPNVLKSWGRVFAVLPDCDLKGKCYHAIKAFAEGKSEAFAKAFGEAFPKAYAKESGNMALSPSPSITPSPSIAKAPTNKSDQSQKDFDAFWSEYPRKVGKAKAKAAWDKAENKPAIDVVLQSLITQRGTDQWMDEQFIPHPASWINGERWADEIDGGIVAYIAGLEAQEREEEIIDAECTEI